MRSAPPPHSRGRLRRRVLALTGGAVALVAVAACQPTGAAPGVSGVPDPTLTTTAARPAPTTTTTTTKTSTSLAAGARYVSPTGSDSATGTSTAPWRTIQKALLSVRAGDTVYVRGGTYTENIKVSASQMHAGTATAPVRIFAYPGERPVVRGLLHLTNPSYWHLDGINVTWSTANTRSSHMVKLLGGTGWRFSGAEVWDARSYAAVLVGQGAKGFRIDGNYVHDTHPSNELNQDHLIYVDNGQTGSGTIERNVLARSANGRGVKLGPGSLSQPGTSNIVVRYNTFYANQGPSNVQLSGSSSNNQIYRNILDTSGSGQANVTRWNLSGTGNVVKDNVGWRSARVADFSSALGDGGGNITTDPKLADPSGGDFRATSTAAQAYGAHAR